MPKINKEVVANNLRMLMARLMYSPKDLAIKADISKHQIDNILYARALKIDTLNKIAKALDIRTEILISNVDPKQDKDFDINIYSKIICAIQKTLEQYQIKTTKLLIERISNIIYKNYQHFTSVDEAVKGIMLYLLDTDPDVVSLENIAPKKHSELEA
jgi:DNA-binding Xre family transcriptional regulator